MSERQLGLMLPTIEGFYDEMGSPRWADLREMARTAEAIGVDTIWVADHLLFRRDPMMLIPEGETRGPWEAWTLLSALAEATSRVTLGPFVACTSFRNPALLAKMADTLDEISGGRLILGLGAGWHEPEYLAFGFPFDHRVSRFEEALRIIVPLLREGKVDFEGTYYTARECELRPRGPRPNGPPIWIGGGRPRMLGLVARWADAYNTDFRHQPADIVPMLAGLDEACRGAGRDPATIEKTSAVRIAFADAPGPVQVRVFERSRHQREAVTGHPKALAEHLRAFFATGVRHMTCMVIDPPGVPGIERFAAVTEALGR